MIRLQAGAFLSLCYHLRMRSDTVQNMELMTISGFCRNCLAKVSLCVLCSLHSSIAVLILPPHRLVARC